MAGGRLAAVRVGYSRCCGNDGFRFRQAAHGGIGLGLRDRQPQQPQRYASFVAAQATTNAVPVGRAVWKRRCIVSLRQALPCPRQAKGS
jgi:hypothetical protein